MTAVEENEGVAMNTVLKRADDVVLPSEAEVQLAKTSGRLLAACIGHGEQARLIVHDGCQQPIDVPVAALRLLVDILAQMGQGNAVSLVPVHAELTTQQAADFLHVSRPFLVQRLERKELPFRRVGTHRRIAFRDLLAYREKMQQKSRDAADELAADAQELGMGY